MSRSSGSDNSGCGTAIVALLVISVIITVLRAVWWLLLILAAAAFVAAFVLFKKDNETKSVDEGAGGEFFTQQCPNCGGQIKVGVYDRTAHCQYCDSSFEPEHEPLERVPEEKEGIVENLTTSPTVALIVIGAIFAVLGLVGFAFSGSNGTSSTEPSSSATPAPVVSSASASSASSGSSKSSESSKSSTTAKPAVSTVSDIELKATTEFLEYSNKEVDPLTLVTPNSTDTVIKTEDAIDLSKVGKKSIRYDIFAFDQSIERTVTFTVRDTKAPIISLSNDKPSIDQWGEFDPASCITSIADPVDGDLGRVDAAPTAEAGKRAGTEQLYEVGWYTIDGTIDASTPGTYSFIITASDKHGNTSTKELLATVNEVVQAAPAPEPAQAAPVHTYILNANSGKIHLPSCRDVAKMKDSNKIEITATREEMLAMGYDRCQHCNP